MIVPIKLSNIIFLALLIACNMLANGDWIYSIKKNGMSGLVEMGIKTEVAGLSWWACD